MLKRIFGSKNTNTISNAEVEKAMTTVDGEKLGESEEILLYGGFQELNDYYFFEALFMSIEGIKSKKGATITFKSKNGDFTLNSSTLEFESDYAKSVQRNAIQISFDIEKTQIKKIQKGAYESIEFTVKKKVFNLLKN
jgi:hypothetical protein